MLERRHLQKLRRGCVVALVAPIWVESRYKPTGALKRGLQILDALTEDLTECQSFRLVRCYEEYRCTLAQKRIGLVIGVEGGEIIEDDLGLLRSFYRLGVRCFGLVWNQRNLIADGWDYADKDRGLTDFGRQVIEELDRLGIVIDLAHLAPKSFFDVLQVTESPVIVSHTCTSKHHSLRGMTDEQLRAVAENEGVVGIFAVNSGTDTAAVPDLQAYCDHVEHATEVAGPEHVGLGPDFYDYFLEDLRVEYPGANFQPVKGLEDHTKLGAVISELSDRGLSDEELRMISGENFARIFRDVVG